MPDDATPRCEHCGTPIHRRGKWRPHRFCGEPCANAAKTRPVADRFWEKVERSPDPDGCWVWTAATTRIGYGVFAVSRKRKNVRAHRFAWELTHGPIPDGLCVCHACDNPPCVRPDHLWLGTSEDNTADRHRKGRTAKPSSVAIERDLHGRFS